MFEKGFALVLCLFLAIGLTGCGAGDEKADEIHIGYFNNVTHAQALLMKSEKSLEKRMGEDMKVTWTAFNAGPAEVEALLPVTLISDILVRYQQSAPMLSPMGMWSFFPPLPRAARC